MAAIVDGDASNNQLSGDEGSDIITGYDGDDVLQGFGGADILIGGAGNDFLNGGDGPELSTLEGFVYRLYLSTLGREPDSNGLYGWVSVLESGGNDQSGVASGFVNSAEFQATYGALDDSGFVELLYNNVLGRASDPAGLQGWLDAMSSGLSRADVVLGFSNSAEFISNTEYPSLQYFASLTEGNLGAVYRAYEAVLDRAPDIGGFQGWLDVLDSQQSTLQQVIDGFTGSAEFQTTYGTLTDAEFVTLLYNNVLQRSPDTAGLQAWLDQLSSGTTRAEVVLGFSESSEFVASTQADLKQFIADNFIDQTDILIGGQGNDVLFAGRGADKFIFDVTDSGTDIVFGLDDYDSLEFTNFGYATLSEISTHLVQVGPDTVFTDQGVTVTFRAASVAEVEAALVLQGNPVGTDNDDVLVGTDDNNTIDGGDGDDSIAGSGGNDTLNGDAGDDVITGGRDDDTISGGAGNDTLNGGGGNDILTGGEGVDTFVFNPNEAGSRTVTDLETGDVVDLSAFGYSTTNEAVSYMTQVGSDVVFTDGDVTIIFSNVTIDDVAAAIDLPEIINGDVGDNVLTGSDKVSTINGSGGHDILSGNGGDDILNGGDGRDILNGGAGNNNLKGGYGDDTFIFDATNPGSNTVADLTTGDTVQLLGFNYNSVDDAEARLSQDGTDVVFADQGMTIVFANTTIQDVVAALDLPNLINGDANDNTLDGTEDFDIINGFAGDDILRGMGDGDQLNGGEGNDILLGGDGADDLNGGAGDDTLYIDFTDTYNGGEGTDTVILFDQNAGSFSLDLALRNIEIVFASNLDDILDGSRVLTSVELNGLSGDDDLTGSNYDDLLLGGEGNDTIIGNDGDDRAEGGDGVDILSGGDGVDTLDGGSDDDIVSGGNGDDVVLGGNGDDTLNGDAGFDFLDGGSGSDILSGGDGGDVLVGGFNADILTGGEGTDVFTFNFGDSLVGAEDTITDMIAGERLVFGTHSFIGESAFTGNGVFEVRYTSGPTTIVELDRNGDGIVDEAINITADLDFTSDGQELTAFIMSPSIDGDLML